MFRADQNTSFAKQFLCGSGCQKPSCAPIITIISIAFYGEAPFVPANVLYETVEWASDRGQERGNGFRGQARARVGILSARSHEPRTILQTECPKT